MESRQTRSIEPMLFWCWASVTDCGPTSSKHSFNTMCSIELHIPCITIVYMNLYRRVIYMYIQQFLVTISYFKKKQDLILVYKLAPVTHEVEVK